MMKLKNKFPTLTGARLVQPVQREITAWGLLEWAYRKECVRAANFVEWSTGFIQCRSDGGDHSPSGIAERGSISGHLAAHADAVNVDEYVKRRFGQSPSYMPIVLAAERGVPIRSEAPTLPSLRPVARLDMRGRPVILSAAQHRYRLARYFCVLDYVGYSDEEKARWCARHARVHADFRSLLEELLEFPLTKWIITALGA